MPNTKDFARVGQTTWFADLNADTPDQAGDLRSETVETAEFTDQEAARQWVESRLSGWDSRQGCDPAGLIRYGRYQDTSFTDNEFGVVRDATWEPVTEDGDEIAYLATPESNGKIDWSRY